MVLFVVVALVAAVSFVGAGEYDSTETNVKMSSEELTNINEYIKEYFKLTKQKRGQSDQATGKVVPERIKIRLYSSPEDIFEGNLKNWENILRYPQFNTSLETKIYIHGWLQNEDRKVYKLLATLYALRGKRTNFITVDWSEYSNSEDFHYVKQQIVPKIAEYLVPMVEKVMETQKNNRVHMIGFDMGAHMAGLVGKRVQGRKIARITGLSPAGRFYNDVPEVERLAKGDAEYVDVIHTNMGGAGIARTVGDVDFLPNGGHQQPAAQVSDDLTPVGKEVVSHMLAQNYFVESVQLGVGGFVGKKCDSWTNFLKQRCALNEAEIMGEPVSRRVNGTVYLKVDKEMKPYYSQGTYAIYPYDVHSTALNSYTTTTTNHA